MIAEGTESGGHVGEMTTMALIPQIVDAVSVPVVAAGGIADGRQLTAAFALGASGVQLGTCLLVAEECPIHENYKNALLKAKDNGTIVTGRIAGTPVRMQKCDGAGICKAGKARRRQDGTGKIYAWFSKTGSV